MSQAFAGGCACGAIRYEISDDPVFSNHCHCRDCQRRSGTGHGSYMAFPDRGRVRLEGRAAEWANVADSGAVKTTGFCPTCGSPVYLTFPDRPGLFIVHAASLDDPGRYAPQAVTFAARELAWDPAAPRLARFEGMPG